MAILEYLRDEGDSLAKTAELFALETGLEAAAVPKLTGTLEKKWSAVVRLQKKLMELEERMLVAEQELKAYRGHSHMGGTRAPAAGDDRNLPRAPAIRSFLGHRGGVTCLAMHPIFALLVSGSDDATIKTWDLESGAHELTLKGHTNGVQAVVFNRAGTLLASCSSDLSIKLWNFQSPSTAPECVRTLRGHDHTISGLAFIGPTDAQLASCSRDTTVRLWEVSTGFGQRSLVGAHTDWVRCIATSADGALLASGGSDRLVAVWALDTCAPVAVLREHSHVVEAVAFPPPGVAVKIDGNKGGSTGLGSENGEASAGLQSQGSAEEAYLVSGSRDKTIMLWNARTGQCLLRLADHENWVRSVRFHPSGQFLLSVSDDRSLRVFDIAKARCIRSLPDAHEQFVSALAQHPTLPYLATGSVNREIKLWECR